MREDESKFTVSAPSPFAIQAVGAFSEAPSNQNKKFCAGEKDTRRCPPPMNNSDH
jgi:hypothetical protein